MQCPSCSKDSLHCSNCGFELEPTDIVLDKEEAQLVFDCLRRDWLPRDHPFHHRAKDLFTKLYKVVDTHEETRAISNKTISRDDREDKRDKGH